MKLAVEIDGEICTLDLARTGEVASYMIKGAIDSSGSASIAELAPGSFSVLLANRSFDVRIARSADALEVWVGTQRHVVSVADARDRPAKSRKAGASGPVELRAQMPGKIIRLMVQPGATVEAGQGLIVVEAMKMQNEMKSPKDGTVSKIHAMEGSTVVAGQALLVVE